MTERAKQCRGEVEVTDPASILGIWLCQVVPDKSVETESWSVWVQTPPWMPLIPDVDPLGAEVEVGKFISYFLRDAAERHHCDLE